ncbi:hypothetical protein SAMN05216323_100154 [Williamwhitmania taraxaci]|uniref:Uncharacterized protein n=1 Tax=Williamwhitmania taraxaci TaxID=1640674 RepID=A0A1G6GGY1_9BACT|nr:hypothetical protein SAMN05216323_100154 [Williamwhitmania taraxaci]
MSECNGDPVTTGGVGVQRRSRDNGVGEQRRSRFIGGEQKSEKGELYECSGDPALA